MITQLGTALCYRRKVKYIHSIGNGQHHVYYNQYLRKYSPVVLCMKVVTFMIYSMIGNLDAWKDDMEYLHLVTEGKCIISKPWDKHSIWERFMRLYI